MLRISAEFGFTPASRGRIAAPPPVQGDLFDSKTRDPVIDVPTLGPAIRFRALPSCSKPAAALTSRMYHSPQKFALFCERYYPGMKWLSLTSM
jgi:hypothetical protein